jgi:DNA-binding LacI/PurR family transcriptional regulator
LKIADYEIATKTSVETFFYPNRTRFRRIMPTFVVRSPLPKYRATESLCRQLIEHILAGGFRVGDPFLSDRAVMEAAGRSRSAVRKALDQLQRDGWIERRGGVGTFVGPRLAMPATRHKVSKTAEKRLVRLAAVAAGLGRLRHDWYSGMILHGIDEASVDDAITVEFLGDHHAQPGALARRLVHSRPDVFACIGPPLAHTSVIGEAGRSNIPCILAGIRTPEVGLPNIFEDSAAASAAAIKHLAEAGHSRIGFVHVASAGWWTFDRHEGYLRGLTECGVEPDEGLVLWLPAEPTPEGLGAFQRYLARQKPTAVLFGCCWATAYLQQPVAAGKLRVPDDLSVVTFDQHPEVKRWLGGVRPATIELPLRQIGRTVAAMARQLVEGQDVPAETALPCVFSPGETIRRR